MADDLVQRARKWRQDLPAEARKYEFPLLRLGSAIALLLVGAVAAAIAILAIRPAGPPPATTASENATPASFAPPPLSDIPTGSEGEAIRRGMALFEDPRTNAGQFVGNSLACKNCHLDSGRRAGSSPMWAAWVSYPQYRKKTGTINTMEERIKQCFRFSMNAPNSPSGGPPPDGSAVYADMESYFHWLAKGAPTGTKMHGAGYPTPPLPQGGYDPGRGAEVFAATCTGCHGSDGQGARQADGKVIYPPLWGARSYNWGAGMARVDLAAGFIRANMPFDQPGTLTDQQAWDVAAFMDSHERPRDPRQTASVGDNAKANFSGQQTYYGKMVDGRLLGTGVSAAR